MKRLIVLSACLVALQPCVCAPLRAQRPDSTATVHHRGPAVATALSAIAPGVGQWYAGRPAKGTLIALGFGLFVAANVNAYNRDERCDDEIPLDQPQPAGCSIIIDAPALRYAGLAAFWLWGVTTAAGDARAFNERHRVGAVVQPTRDGGTRLGISIGF